MRQCTDPPVERFPAIDALENVLHGFVLRVPGLDVRTNRAVALKRLEEYHQLAAGVLEPGSFVWPNKSTATR